MCLGMPLSALNLSDKMREKLDAAGFLTMRDVLLHLPLRYENRSRITAIADMREGDEVQIKARVLGTQFKGKGMFSVKVSDGTGVAFLHYFHASIWLARSFSLNREALFFGRAVFNSFASSMQMNHPEIKWLKDDSPIILPDRLTPVYRMAKKITQSEWQKLLDKVFAFLNTQTPDTYDPLKNMGMMDFYQALDLIHHPPLDVGVTSLVEKTHPACKRLIFEELCAHRLAILRSRQWREAQKAPALPKADHIIQAFVRTLPFQLTQAQEAVFADVAQDMQKDVPMLRLVQGDVGSGKTMIALLSALQAVHAGKQVAILAPTELLAEQHVHTFKRLLKDSPIRIELLVSKLKVREKRALLQDIQNGEVAIIIGTHALFQDDVFYKDLALVVIDEQHRFGVQQRLQLQNKASQYTPHQLVLTATPIPRTLAMSLYGELNTSVIRALPKGRLPIRTSVLSNEKRAMVAQKVGDMCRLGMQAYWVCPLIEESEVLDYKNVEESAQFLRNTLPDLNIAVVHGKTKIEERQTIMQDFAQGKIHLLVATTVIEVGIDVPNANLMIIENAERFGLSQLHQLRGRVGRGSVQADCVLLYQSPLSERGKARLEIMRKSHDGFVIAEEDMKLRGAGDLLGTRQAGEALFFIADVLRDLDTLESIEQITQEWFANNDPFITTLEERWLKAKEQFLQV